jgi:hypothetical protein
MQPDKETQLVSTDRPAPESEQSIFAVVEEAALARQRAIGRRSQARYRAGEKGRAMRKAYEARPQVREAQRQRRRGYRQTAHYRAQDLLDKALSRARERKEKCTLTHKAIVQKLLVGRCELSGLPFHMGPTSLYSKHPLAPSLDKIVPSGFYTDANTRVVCTAVNIALSEWGPLCYLLIQGPAVSALAARLASSFDQQEVLRRLPNDAPVDWPAMSPLISSDTAPFQ